MTSSRIVQTIPPWAIPSQPWNRSGSVELGPAAIAVDVELEVEAVLVELAAGEAVVRLELEALVDPLGDRGPQTSRLRTFRASVLMKSLRGATFSPISIVKIASASAASLDLGPEQRPRLRVHRRLPELVGVHLAEALEALDGDVLDGSSP